jgi:hypothetical protein
MRPPKARASMTREGGEVVEVVVASRTGAATLRWIVLSPALSDMSKVAKAPARLTPLDAALALTG